MERLDSRVDGITRVYSARMDKGMRGKEVMDRVMPARVIVIVLDSVGIGEAPDAHEYGDEGSNTLTNTALSVGGLDLPNMASLGLAGLPGVKGISPPGAVTGACGVMTPRSPGKDTMSGHWELMGLVLERPMRTFPNGFPPELIAEFERVIGRPTLGNVAASGTEIIARLGEEHMRTGWPIVYTSADSVFQIAAHEDVVSVDELYRMCEAARRLLTGDYLVGRVIARPFTGNPGAFKRTARRRDFSLEPPGRTVLDLLTESGATVLAIGKIEDIFSGRGITDAVHTSGNEEGQEVLVRVIKEGSRDGKEMVFANLVDFDMLYGHRNDARGYAEALRSFDRALGLMLPHLRPDDLLLITADHGCDPTTPSTDHSRERVPVLAAGPNVRPGYVGMRRTFADLGATVTHALGFSQDGLPGESFLMSIWKG